MSWKEIKKRRNMKRKKEQKSTHDYKQGKKTEENERKTRKKNKTVFFRNRCLSPQIPHEVSVV